MSAEKYREGWVRVVLQVSPDGEFNAVAGDREQGDPMADLPYIGMERLKAAINRTRNQALEDAAKIAEDTAMRASNTGLELHEAKQLNETARAHFRALYLQATATANAIKALKSN